MHLRRLALVVLSVAFAAQPVEAVAAPTLPSPRGGGEHAVRSAPSGVGRLPSPRVVDVRAIAKRPSRARATPSWLQSPTPTLPRKGAGIYAATSGPKAVEAATIFAGLSLAQNEQNYGQGQLVEPADAQLAASSSWLVEIAGNTMALFGSDGSLQWTVDLQALFQLPAGYFFYAPSLQFDYGSGRWFVGGIASNTTNHDSWLLLAVSQTGSPLATWSWFITDLHYNNATYFMRESIAVVGDKVVQANQAQYCGTGCSNIQGAFVVIRKDHLLAGVQPAVDRFSLASNQTDFLAVQPQSVGGTYANIAFLVWLKAGGSVTNLTPDRLGLLQITGLPYPDRIYSYQGTTTVWEKDFSAVMPPLSIAPAQPGGTLSASPTPITSAIFRDGQVVLAMNDKCGPGAPNQVYCVRIIKETNFGNATPVATDNGSTGQTVPPPISSDFEFGVGGFTAGNLFDASLAIDPSGNLFASMAFSAPNLTPGMAVFGVSAPISSTSTFMPVSPIVEGPSSYNCFAGSNNPWGAYMRSVPDPNNFSRVWMPAEAAVGSCWATAMVSATMGVPPHAVKMSPAFGSVKGGQVVEVGGSFFVPNANQVLFGSNPGTILAESPTTILVSAPPGVAGAVAVTVQTPDGTSNALTFTYITPGERATPPASTGGFHRR